MIWTKRPAPAAASGALAPNTNGTTGAIWGLDASNSRHMAFLTLGFLAFHLVLWTVLATISHRAPPWDNVEQLVWMQSLEWGYYKHPPFPTWWVHGWTSLLGRTMWVLFFSAQLSVVLMLFFVWRIALLVTSPARAFAAIVLTSLLIYHGVHGIMANHNTLQLMPVGLLLWLSLLAVRGQQWWRWALAGGAAAVCLLAKYSALIWLVVIGVWLLQDPRMRSWRAGAGAALALAVCAVLVGPHIEWLIREGYPSLGYAGAAVQGQHDANTLGHWGRLWMFVIIQVSRALPTLIGLGLLYALVRKSHRVALPTSLPQAPEWRFVLFMALGPVLLTSILGVTGVRLGSAWAATFFVLFGVWALRWIPSVSPALLVRAVLWVGLGMELLLASGMALGSGWLVDWNSRPARSNFPSVLLAKRLDAVWQQHAKTPLRVVVGETWLAGNVSFRSKDKPMVFIDGDVHKSPWIHASMLRDCGALVVVDRRDFAEPKDPRVSELLDQAAFSGTVNIPWTRHEDGPRLEVEWAILPAQRPEACPAAS